MSNSILPKDRTPTRQQGYELQDLAYKLAMKLGKGKASESEQQVARDITALIRAWSDACEQVRIARGKPLPGTLRPVAKKPKTRPESAPAPQVESASVPLPCGVSAAEQPTADPNGTSS
jgi:hypothetical protein